MKIRNIVQWSLLSLMACGSAGGANGPSGTVEIYSWWTSGSEQTALHALLADYAMKYPAVVVSNAAEEGSATAMSDLQKRMAGGNPPDTFQVNGGVELMQYVVTNGRDATQSKLETVDTLFDQTLVPADVLSTVTYGGHAYAVPVDIARVNALFYNKAVFSQYNLQPPSTIADFVSVAQTLQANGVIPLAVGDQGPWVLEVIFKSCMVAEGGAAYYKQFVGGENAYLSGASTTRDAILSAAVSDYTSIMTYANKSTMKGLSWDQAVQLVAGKQSAPGQPAAMTIMGDWALGELINLGLTPDVDFGEVPAPGSSGTFIFTTDTFVLPIGAPNRTGAISLLEEWGSASGQAAFNPVKGSIAVRTDADSTIYNSISQKTLQDFHSLPLVGDFALTVPTAFVTPFDAALDQLASDSDAQNFVLAVKNNYQLLVTVP